MYYFEIRFLEKEKSNVCLFMGELKKRLEIISINEDDYYICYRLKKPIDSTILTEIKNYSSIYFLTHYKI